MAADERRSVPDPQCRRGVFSGGHPARSEAIAAAPPPIPNGDFSPGQVSPEAADRLPGWKERQPRLQSS